MGSVKIAWEIWDSHAKHVLSSTYANNALLDIILATLHKEVLNNEAVCLVKWHIIKHARAAQKKSASDVFLTGHFGMEHVMIAQKFQIVKHVTKWKQSHVRKAIIWQKKMEKTYVYLAHYWKIVLNAQTLTLAQFVAKTFLV